MRKKPYESDGRGVGETGETWVEGEKTKMRKCFKKNLNASKPSEHPPQVEECLKV